MILFLLQMLQNWQTRYYGYLEALMDSLLGTPQTALMKALIGMIKISHRQMNRFIYWIY